MRLLPLAGLLLVALAGHAADERTPLAIRDYDTVVPNRGDPIQGTISKSDHTGVRIVPLGHSGNGLWFALADVSAVEYRQDAAAAVTRRGEQAMAANDLNDVLRAVRWGIDHSATAPALALAAQALTKEASAEIGALLLPLLWEAKDANGVVEAAKRILALDSRWEAGYEHLAKAYAALGRQVELDLLVKTWLERMPTSLKANQLAAAAAEQAGDLRSAQEAYRKCWDLHQDHRSGVDYARLALRRGDRANALKAADALLTMDKFPAECRAIAGSVQAQAGDDAAARPLLEQALTGELSPELKIWADYNLGLVDYRAGRLAEAKTRWGQIDHPVAKTALALAERRRIEIEVPDALRPLVAEANAALDLMRKQLGSAAVAAVDPKLGKRQQFLALVSALLKNPTEANVRALAIWPGVESLRWQAFGHLLGNRAAPAELALTQLPAEDGWAAVARVYAAEMRKERVKAYELYRKALDSVDPPADYLAQLKAVYATIDDDLMAEDFSWGDKEVLNSGWQSSTPGTGIVVHPRAGFLVLEGTQSAGDVPESRAWQLVNGERLRQVTAVMDFTGMATANGGLEILDESGQNGLALGLAADNHLQVRLCTTGAWADWQPLPVQVQGRQVTLAIEHDCGRLTVVHGDGPKVERHATKAELGVKPGMLRIGVFGAAAPGTAWRLAVDQMSVQLRARAKAR